jgi:2',3'-cyclic-nucleotide 2'-phosphodiesterase (5'-nucleotidase family)
MRCLVFVLALFSSNFARLCAADPNPNPNPEALVLIVGDQHSAYERTAQLVARIDQLRAAHPGVPFAVLIDGDSLEYGNIVARRSAGAIDFALFAALARRVPTILNLGNHEPEFYAVDDTVARIQATGVTVISNLVNHFTGQQFAPVSTGLRLGAHKAVVVGLATDKLATYRAAIRPSLDLSNPVVWAKQNLASFFPPATALPILLTHTGLNADRALLEIIPDGTLFAGAHDHLRFVHNAGRSVYFHSGSWNDGYSLATLRMDSAGQPRWSVAQFPLAVTDPADPELAALIQKITAQHLGPEDLVVLGRNPTALAPTDAARFVVAALRAAARADAAVIGATTFGAGLPAGEVTRVALDACVRFDGTIFVAEISGAELNAILAQSNQDPATAFSARRGENLVAVGPVLPINPARRYRLATTDWGAKNALTYFGSETLSFVEQPSLRLKTLVSDALSPALSVVP